MATNSIGSIKTAAMNASYASSARQTGGIKASSQQAGGAKAIPQQTSAAQQTGGGKIPVQQTQQTSATQQTGGAKIPPQQSQKAPTVNDAPRPLTNLNGQRTGTLINTSA